MRLTSLSQQTSKVRIGRIITETGVGGDFRLDPDWMTRGCVIVGKSGTGKSHDIDLLAGQVSQLGHAVVILDRTGEHAEALSRLSFAHVMRPGQDFSFRLLAPSDPTIESTDEAIEDILDTLSHYFVVSFGQGPTPLQQRVIRENLETHFRNGWGVSQGTSVVDFMSLVRHYQDFKKNVHGFAESCESVVSRLHPLCIGSLGRVFDQSKEGFSVQDLFAPVLFVMDLSSLKYEPAKNLLSQILLKQLFQEARRLGRVDGLRQLVVVDEAHNVAPRDPEYQSFLEMIAIENRKYGQGLVVATTSPSQLSEALLRNASIRFCHLLDDGKDIDLMLRFMVNRLEIDRYLADVRMLGLGEALVQVSAPKSIPPTRVAVQFDEPKKL